MKRMISKAQADRLREDLMISGVTVSFRVGDSLVDARFSSLDQWGRLVLVVTRVSRLPGSDDSVVDESSASSELGDLSVSE